MKHETWVSEVHTDVPHSVVPIMVDAVGSLTPKLVPNTLMVCEPESGPLYVFKYERTGASYEKAPTFVPTIAPTVT